MKKRLKITLKFLAFFSAGIFLFWLVYKDQNVSELWSALKKVNYFWIWVSLFIGILSHVARALRWNMLAKSLGYHPKTINSFFYVMIGYLANLALPRMGEVTRSVIINRYEKMPITKAFGTIVLERIIDMIMLLLCTLIVLFTQFHIPLDFIHSHPEIAEKFSNINFLNILMIFFIIVIVFGLIFVFFNRRIKNSVIYKKLADLIRSFFQGLKTIKTVNNKPLFIFYSFLIWFFYFLMMYLCFFSIPETSDLSVFAGLTAFVMGSFAMIAPVQGGMGAWHFMVIATLISYGIDGNTAKVFALVCHESMTAMLIVVGFISLIAIPLVNKNNK
ncbi:MAG: flippase-like domain-containing protein [Bacteroidales bacterium]|nr:flippase-like domain-containing protein [Bacteroidales bacterium]